MYCIKCCLELSADAQFCSACGSKQNGNMTAEAPANYQANNSVVQKQLRVTAALVLGIIGLLAWLLPLAGFPITILGIVVSVTGVNIKKAKASAALILNIIGLVLCTINSFVGAIMGANGMLFQ